MKYFLLSFLEVPPEKPPPLKYHLYTKDTPKSDEVEVSESEDDVDLDATLEERHIYHQQGSIQITTECNIISPGAVVPGTLAITTDALYFTADDESEELKTLDPMVREMLHLACSIIIGFVSKD